MNRFGHLAYSIENGILHIAEYKNPDSENIFDFIVLKTQDFSIRFFGQKLEITTYYNKEKHCKYFRIRDFNIAEQFTTSVFNAVIAENSRFKIEN